MLKNISKKGKDFRQKYNSQFVMEKNKIEEKEFDSFREAVPRILLSSPGSKTSSSKELSNIDVKNSTSTPTPTPLQSQKRKPWILQRNAEKENVSRNNIGCERTDGLGLDLHKDCLSACKDIKLFWQSVEAFRVKRNH